VYPRRLGGDDIRGLGFTCALRLGCARDGQEVKQVRRDGGSYGGPGPDAEPQCRGGVQGGAGGEVDGLGEPGQPSRDHDDRPCVARARTGQPTGGAVGDQREAVRDQGIQPGDPGRHCSGERDLVQAVGGGYSGAERDRQTGQPERRPCRSARAMRAGHRVPARVT